MESALTPSSAAAGLEDASAIAPAASAAATP
jgi:hypothetical protein